MTDIGKLIELIEKEVPRPKADAIAYHLLANGVIVPVLCKDCKNYNCDKWFCELLEKDVNENEYCSYGELKERKGK